MFFLADGNGLPYYQATANVRLVGAHAARLVHHLVTIYGVQAANVHFIGHSLGAHGSGYAGEALKKNYDMVLGRITGLDPAGLYFENLKPTVRLDPTDAAFVDTVQDQNRVISLIPTRLFVRFLCNDCFFVTDCNRRTKYSHKQRFWSGATYGPHQ